MRRSLRADSSSQPKYHYLPFSRRFLQSNQELGILKGQLSRWLLPFNTDTSVDEQQAATPRRFQESLLASSATSRTAGGSSGGTLTEEEAEYLTAGARRVRQLVRSEKIVKEPLSMGPLMTLLRWTWATSSRCAHYLRPAAPRRAPPHRRPRSHPRRRRAPAAFAGGLPTSCFCFSENTLHLLPTLSPPQAPLLLRNKLRIPYFVPYRAAGEVEDRGRQRPQHSQGSARYHGGVFREYFRRGCQKRRQRHTLQRPPGK